MPDSSDENSGPLFELDLGKNGGLLSPDTAEELGAWIQREREQWAWVQKVRSRGNFRAAIDQARQRLDEARTELASLSSAEAGSQQAKVSARRVREHINSALVDWQLPHSTTPAAARVIALKETDPLEAMAYLFAFLKPNSDFHFDGEQTSAWKGFIRGLEERYGITKDSKGRVGAISSALEELRQRFDQQFSERDKQIEGMRSRFESQLTDAAVERDSQAQRFDGLMSESATRLKDAEAAHTAATEALRQRFQSEMALRGPVGYWSARQIHHSGRARVFGGLVIAGMILLAGGLWLLLSWMIQGLGSTGAPEAWKGAIAFAVAVLGIWSVRLLVKMLLSHIHLATDAAERMTMVQTYLALLESGASLDEEDRQLVLGALFRRGSDGLVKDDAMPHPGMDLLTKIK